MLPNRHIIQNQNSLVNLFLIPILENVKSGTSVFSIRSNSIGGLENQIDPSAVSEAKTIVHEEILRLVSSMMSCIGVKSLEQSLLR